MAKMAFMNIGAVICFAVAGCMAVEGISGWGWFLFAGLLCV
jgi:hypothetical protein